MSDRSEARPPTDPWTRLAAVLLAVFAVVVLVTFRDYGLSWDEEHSADNGRFALAWFLSLGGDDRVVTGFNQRFYGSFFNLLVQLAAKVSPFGFYETNHLLIAAVAWLGVLYTFRLGRLIAGPRAGFFAALCFVLTPPFYGHAFMNPKDVPLAGLFVTGAYYLVQALDELPAPRRRSLAAFAIVTGCAAGVRVVGMFLVGYWAIGLALWAIGELAARRPPPLARMAGWIAVPGAVAWLVMVACWPYAQENPLWNPIQAFLDNARFAWPGSMLFDGTSIAASAAPTRYLPTWFAISMPEFYAAALVAGVVPALAFLARTGRGRRWRTVVRIALVALAGVLPPFLAAWHHAVLYDGMRHFLFVVPFFAFLAGIGLSAGVGDVAAAIARPRPLAVLRGAVAVAPVAAAACSLALTVVDLVELHPYEYVYFNRLVAGGEAAGAERFETDYWGLSYKEGLEWLRANYPTGERRVTVANCSDRSLTAYWIENDPDLSRRFIAADASNLPRILLATTRYNCHKRGGRVLHVVERKGVGLMYVLEKDDAASR